MADAVKVPLKVVPWIRGVVDTLAGAKVILATTIPHKNRLAVILYDSAFEIACRAFLQYKERIKLENAHRVRENLMKVVKARLKDVDPDVWQIIDFYYQEVRCELYHDSASKTITDEALLDYEDAVLFVIDLALNVKARDMLAAYTYSTPQVVQDSHSQSTKLLSNAKTPVDRLIVAVDAIRPSGYEQLRDWFRKAGVPPPIKEQDFTNTMARNTGSKKYFYFNKVTKCWELSGIGVFRLSQLSEGETNE